MFEGFTDRTFEFYMAIRFNNNRAFFQDNRAWYEQSVRRPMVALCEALGPIALELDPGVDTRPVKCVARVNRDTRFSKDKSPYRDYSFLKFRQDGEDKTAMLGIYFDISDSGASYGMGIYDRNVPLMRALRRRIELFPDEVAALTAPVEREFTLMGNVIKRMSVPQSVPEPLKPWYPLRGFYVEKDLNDFSLLKSPALVDELACGYRLLGPLYRYVHQLAPIEE